MFGLTSHLVFLIICKILCLRGETDNFAGDEFLLDVDNEDNSTDTYDEDIFVNYDEKNVSLVDGMCGNTTMLEHILNTTQHRGLLHGFSESITVILVSEIGDKTFFIAAILAMRNNKLTVFLAAVSALFLMTILSALLGWVVTTFIPREYTYYTCTAIMFLFGLKMLWEAWRMDDNETEETQKEVELELAEMDGDVVQDGATAERGEADGTDRTGNGGSKEGKVNEAFESEAHKASQTESTTSEEKSKGKTSKSENASSKESWMDNVIDNSCRENSWFGKKCLKIFKLFVNCFSMTFIAEWGDRSQLATIVLAGLNDVRGVILGGCLGHAICTGGAVLVGTLIAKFISARKVTFIGALVFIGFAIASIFTNPNEDGIDGIPDIAGYDNCTRLLNHNISQTLELEEEGLELLEY